MSNNKICVIGLGNVGLDLALALSEKYATLGYDKSKTVVLNAKKSCKTKKIDNLKKGLFITQNFRKINDCNIYIITVPTGVYKNNKPNLKNIYSATKLVAGVLSKGDIVIYESTFYPGLTEEFCVPLIEESSNYKLNIDFYVGYSPERINIGREERKTKDIIKITSGSSSYANKVIDDLYKSIIDAGTYNVESIKIAEAAKILENCQRDLNIAMMNELSLIFKEQKIEINKVIQAAATKWNFLEVYPGLVGGDCIAVDPYYLIHKAKNINTDAKLISSARKINESMVSLTYNSIEKIIKKEKLKNKFLFFGVTYKPETNQIKNSKYYEIFEMLSKKYDVTIANEHTINDMFKDLDCNKFKDVSDTNYDKYELIIIGCPNLKYKKLTFKPKSERSYVIIDLHGINNSYDYKIF